MSISCLVSVSALVFWLWNRMDYHFFRIIFIVYVFRSSQLNCTMCAVAVWCWIHYSKVRFEIILLFTQARNCLFVPNITPLFLSIRLECFSKKNGWGLITNLEIVKPLFVTFLWHFELGVYLKVYIRFEKYCFEEKIRK